MSTIRNFMIRFFWRTARPKVTERKADTKIIGESIGCSMEEVENVKKQFGI